MKKIGMLGGLSFESTTQYYSIINHETQKRLGGTASAEILMYSFNFAEVEALQTTDSQNELTEKFIHWASALKTAGADFIIICANTMNRMAPEVAERADIPVLHIAEVTGNAINQQGIKKVALLGTRYVMEGDFYKNILEEKFNLDVMTPDAVERAFIHNTIFEELIKGIISEDSRAKFVAIINRLTRQGAEGVILGCTEIPLLIEQKHVSIPVFNTTHLHALAAVDLALEESDQ